MADHSFARRATFLIAAIGFTAAVHLPWLTGCSGSPGVADQALSASQEGTVYYVDDHLGSAQIVADAETGALYEEAIYPYGLSEGSAEGSDGADYSYTTKERDVETDLVYFGVRYFSPEMGRWLTPDPSFLRSPARAIGRPLEANLYLFVRNNPVRWIDLIGEAAGDPYFSQHMAAQMAIAEVNPTSIYENREYGGYVYRMDDGYYSYTEAVRGNEDSVILHHPRWVTPAGTSTVAYYHTHADFSTTNLDCIFSDVDITLARENWIDAYLGTPAGDFKFYDHDEDRISALGRVPTEPGEVVRPYFLDSGETGMMSPAFRDMEGGRAARILRVDPIPEGGDTI